MFGVFRVWDVGVPQGVQFLPRAFETQGQGCCAASRTRPPDCDSMNFRINPPLKHEPRKNKQENKQDPTPLQDSKCLVQKSKMEDHKPQARTPELKPLSTTPQIPLNPTPSNPNPKLKPLLLGSRNNPACQLQLTHQKAAFCNRLHRSLFGPPNPKTA